MSYRFHPPRTDGRVMWAVQLLLPVFMRLHDQMAGVRLEPEDRQRLEGLRGRRALILPNHPSETEPVVLQALSHRLGEPFHYVATHEIFHGVRGWLINRIGAYSIRRGWPDVASLRMSRRLLAEEDRKVVIFPEGETHMQNELILPLHRGAIQIAFWSLERLESLGRPPDLPLVPLVIRYGYVGDARPALLRGLSRLEQMLGLPASDAPLVDRARRTGLEVLAGVEREYGVRPSAGATVDERIGALYERMATRVAEVIGCPLPEHEAVHIRMRALFNRVFDYVDGLALATTPYERSLHARRLKAAEACLADLWRMQNFMVIGSDSLAPPVSPEQVGEVLFRMEKEVYGAGRTRPLREAVVRIGEPLGFADRLADYREDRRGTVAACTIELEDRLRDLLASLTPAGGEYSRPATGRSRS